MITADEITKQYEKTRLKNTRILQQREDEIYRTIPNYKNLAISASLSYVELAKKRLMGNIDEVTENKSICRANTKNLKELLVSYGYPSDYLEPIYDCHLCKDYGSIGASRCKCFTDQIIGSLYLQSNLTNILNKENFDTFSLDYYSDDIPAGYDVSSHDNMVNILKSSKSYITNFKEKKGNILIYGETGLGKTFLSNCIAKELLDQSVKVLYVSANELFCEIISPFIMNKKIELEDLYKYIYNSELLIIDDLGTELTNDFVLSHLFEIINKRSLSNAATIISTNLTLKQINDRYSQRIMSRIMDNYTVFNIYGDNIRYQKRKRAIISNT